MMLSHRHRFIFVKTLKTAGTSIEVLLQYACIEEGRRPASWEDWHTTPEQVSSRGIVGSRGGEWGMTFWNHMPPSEIQSALGMTTWLDYETYASVRNPWDKVASMFFFLNPTNSQTKPDDLGAVRERLGRYVSTHRLPEVEIEICAPQTAVDHAIRYEHLESDLHDMARADNFELPPSPWPHLKGQFRPAWALDYRSLYSDEAAAQVATLYSAWIRHFDYRFEDGVVGVRRRG